MSNFRVIIKVVLNLLTIYRSFSKTSLSIRFKSIFSVVITIVIYQNNLVDAQLKLFAQEEIVKSLTDNIDKLNESNEESVDTTNDVGDSVEQTNTIYQTYLDTIRKLANQEQILGDEFDLTEESIKETQKSLIELLNASQENTQAFQDLQKELKN